MEASTAAPAAAPAQPAAPAAGEAPAQAGFAGAPPAAPPAAAPEAQPQVAEQPAEGDLQTQLDQALARADAAEAQLTGQQTAPPAQGQDFLTALQGAEQELGITPEELAAREAAQQNPGQEAQVDKAAELSELDAFVQERIDKVIAPMEEARQIEQARGWQASHPDVVPGTPLGDAMLDTMKGLGERYGDDAILDPFMLNLAYTHVKAGQADDGAVPAGQAANHGASIETQAGQTQTGEDSVEDKYIRDLTAGANNRSAFD